MNKYKLFISLFIVSLVASAQEVDNEIEGSGYNKWSIEANVGQTKADNPYTPGYFSSDPNNYFNLINGLDHLDLGLRYMFNTKFGLKLDFGYDVIENQKGTASLPFETKQYRIGLQGVVNMGRVLNFETFTSRLGLLAHGGVQVSRLMPQLDPIKDRTEDNGGLIFGITPQFRITNRIVLTGDVSYLANFRQHLAWDGNYSDPSNNLSGSLYNASLGLTFYLGGNDTHADWSKDKSREIVTDKAAQSRLDELEEKLKDTDGDGVPDYLDVDDSTPKGVVVDTKGKVVDTNINGTPDRGNNTVGVAGTSGRDGVSNNNNTLEVLIEKGFVNVFFDLNKDQPNIGSTNNVYQIISYLREYPERKVKLTGYTDPRGNAEKNRDLSNRRAENLKNIILASGIDASRVSIEGLGVDTNYPNPGIGYDLARRVSVSLE